MFDPNTGVRVAYSIHETANSLKKGINQTYEAVHKGEIPSVKIGARYYVPAWFIRQLRDGPQGRNGDGDEAA